MVNTFLVSSPVVKDPNVNGYRQSAEKLDFKRLNKQITEAIQIVDIIESFEILARYFKDPIPRNENCYNWVRSIKKRYDSLEKRMFRHRCKLIWVSKDVKFQRIKYDEKYEIKEDGIHYNGKVYRKCVLPGDLLITLGFSLHPAVLMWLRRKESLKHYINAHIDEFVHRGGYEKSVLKKYNVGPFSETKHPDWAIDPKFHRNHKAALYTKEKARDEKEHYVFFPDFEESYNFYIDKIATNPKSQSDFLHYIWPYSIEKTSKSKKV